MEQDCSSQIIIKLYQRYYEWDYTWEPGVFSNECIKRSIFTKLLEARFQWSEEKINKSLVWDELIHVVVGEVLGLVDELLIVEHILGLVKWGDYLQDELVEEGMQQLQLLANWK